MFSKHLSKTVWHHSALRATGSCFQKHKRSGTALSIASTLLIFGVFASSSYATVEFFPSPVKFGGEVVKLNGGFYVDNNSIEMTSIQIVPGEDNVHYKVIKEECSGHPLPYIMTSTKEGELTACLFPLEDNCPGMKKSKVEVEYTVPPKGIVTKKEEVVLEK